MQQDIDVIHFKALLLIGSCAVMDASSTMTLNWLRLPFPCFVRLASASPPLHCLAGFLPPKDEPMCSVLSSLVVTICTSKTCFKIE